MNQEDFCRGLYERAVREAVAAETQTLEEPPGREPSTKTEELSRWFHGLSSDGQAFAGGLLRMGAETGVFGVLTILDGVRPIWGPDGQLMTFKLSAMNGEETPLNDPSQEMLHDVFVAVAAESR